MKALHTILKPIVTEKALKLGEKMSYTFYVNKRATKVDVKMAVKELYGQDVASVRMMLTPSKSRAYKRSTITKRPKMKKAIVILKGRKKIDVTKISKDTKK